VVCRARSLEDVGVNTTFWRGRRVLITGHTGFKGAWLALWLHRMGAELCGFALAPATRPSLFETIGIGQLMQSRIADVRDLAALQGAVADFAPEVVFHLAAQSLVLHAYADPVGTYATNVMGTVHLLEAIREQPTVRATVVVTSDKCYENRERVRSYREDEAMGGHDPYSSSKGCAELVVAAYRASFLQARPGGGASGVATARAGNVVGGGDWAEHRLVPDVLRAIVAGEPVRLRRPEAIRPWQHVLEPLWGYLLLAECLCAGGSTFAEGWNFGPFEADERTVHWVASRIANTWGVPLEIESAAPELGQQEAGILKLDSAKARSHLGWRPRWSLATALDNVVRWHQAHATGADMRAFSEGQIALYEESPEAGATGSNHTREAGREAVQ
jgi:CDP-glucose 4,6-dehydratase